MTPRVIHSAADADALATFLKGRKLPVTVSIIAGKKRSTDQNKLQRRWVQEIAEQADDGEGAEWWRGVCKLQFGVPIQRRDDEVFQEKYDRIIKPMPYRTKVECMMEPIDFPVTRSMTTRQKTEYLDAIFRHFTSKGFVLTQPEVVA